MLLGSALVKAAQKKLMKSTPGVHFMEISEKTGGKIDYSLLLFCQKNAICEDGNLIDKLFIKKAASRM